jgi:hypothetical protein
MCCFLIALFTVGPRLAFLIYWLLEPVYIQSVFQTWIWPLLGLIFLPWTTLMYALAYGANGIVGIEWLLIIFAVCVDIAAYASGGYKRKSIPYYSGP